MIRDNLGETIDIHTGGSDLIFPHHENEIAQSEAVTGKPLSRYWLHTGMVILNGEKMSKSLGNFITIRDLLNERYAPPPMAVRLFVLQAHYRKPIDFTNAALKSAQSSWLTLQSALNFGYNYWSQLGWTNPMTVNSPDMEELDTKAVERFQTAMDDDFNSASGLAVLFELAKKLGRARNLILHQEQPDTPPQILEQQWYTLVELAKVLGLEEEYVEPGTIITPPAISEQSKELSDAEIEAMIQQRADARKRKDFEMSDRIRNELASKGITLIDKAGGVTNWHRN